ncbi:MAG TPA: hypothetical protein VNA89_09440 [Gemmatimonadaceae bacterium]|nr:hypothetical protein [Gemmatimonadaceae bacterium]
MVPDPAGLQLRARPLCTSRAVTLQLGKQVAAAILVVAALAHEAAAQQQPPVQVEQRSPRKLVYAIAGAVGGALAGSVFANLASLKDGVTPVVATAAGGAVLGYFLGRQQDRLHALRFRGVAPLRVESRRVELPGSPVALAVRRGRAAVGLSTGFAVVDASGALRVEAERARTLAGVAGVAIADDTGSILLAAGSGAYRFPPTGGGVLLRDGPAWAVAAAPDAYYIAVGDRVERAPSGADTSRVWPGVGVAGRAAALRVDSRRQLLWIADEAGLAGVRPSGDSLLLVTRVTLGAGARALALDGDRLAVAFGEQARRF